MAFGMEHYMHHKYHAHAEAAAPVAEPPAAKGEKTVKSGGAGLPPAAAAAVEPLPTNSDDMMEEIKQLRGELASMRNAIRVAAEAGEAKKK